jgi:hypothetical protein
MTIPKRSFWCIFHHKKWQVVTANTKVEQWYDVRMTKSNCPRFVDKIFEILALGESNIEHLDGGLAMLMYMFSQIDGPKAATPQFVHQTILANLLAEMGPLLIWHSYTSCVTGRDL